jgi:hypothetical protein
MTYDEVKELIIQKIKKEKDEVLEMIRKASKCEDWEEIKESIDFIIQAHGAMAMLDKVKEAGKKFDEDEEKASNSGA